MRPIIVITHAAFDEKRRQSLQHLTSQLRIEAPDIEFVIAEDHEKRGSLWCWRRAMRMGLHLGATHIVQLPDDAEVCRDFGAVLTALIKARPSDVFDCIVNHPLGSEVTTCWYSTTDGYMGHGGVFPRELLVEHLAWREREQIPEEYPNDAGVNLWAMDTARLIYKPSFSLVRHRIDLPSLDGHDNQPLEMRQEQRFLDEHRKGFWVDLPNMLLRSWGASESEAPGLATSCTFLGRTYRGNHQALLELLHPPRVERYLDVERGHGLVPGKPKVFIACPAYRGEVKSDWVISLMQESNILRDAGLEVTVTFKADSLVNRCRNRLVSDFLLSDCTHMLMWDTDNFPTVPGAVKLLVETGHDLVGGAVVLKDGKGDKFALRWGGEGDLSFTTENGCVPVDMLGTGFLMVTRRAVMKIIKAMPETYYRAGRWMDNPGRAEWHLFADKVRGIDHLSEDFEFCKRWQDVGGKVYLQPDISFIHYGEMPFTGSVKKTFFKESEDAAR